MSFATPAIIVNFDAAAAVDTTSATIGNFDAADAVDATSATTGNVDDTSATTGNVDATIPQAIVINIALIPFLFKIFPEEMEILHRHNKNPERNPNGMCFNFFIVSFILSDVKPLLIEEELEGKLFPISDAQRSSLQCCMMINKQNENDAAEKVRRILIELFEDPSATSLEHLKSVMPRAVASKIAKDLSLLSQPDLMKQSETETETEKSAPSCDEPRNYD
jgi:hypothetical protein